MTQALVTVIAPLAQDRLSEAERLIDALGNPAETGAASALDRLDGDAGTHFASLHAVRSCDGARAYLALELTGDGTDAQAVRRLSAALEDKLRPIFLMASDWSSGTTLDAYLLRHRVALGGGWFANAGVAFAGTPGMSVGRIRSEAALGTRVSAMVGAQGPGVSALERLEHVRTALAGDPMLQPATAAPPYDPPDTTSLIAQLAGSFAATYLWPAGLLVLACGLIGGLLAVSGGTRGFLSGALGGLWAGILIALIVVVIAGVWAYAALRQAEADDSIDERAPGRATVAAMFARENRCAQNHMISITQRKPGAVRWFTSRLVFWIIGELVARSYRPGFLSDIGTIHFARWVTPPGSPDVLFFSNYDGSWESYLEDFITRAHKGLTAVWSNSIGFPRASNLFQGGATDGERFKRYARHSMQPTLFWYSAYPSLTTTQIRTNAEIRRGLSGAMTEDEAVRWLALFGSAARPASKLVSSDIQSLVFGGLGFLRYGTCLLHALPQDQEAARAWLRAVRPHVAFNDGRRLQANAVVTLALGASGLARLGLPAEGLTTFPFAFLEGMTTESRTRILGDTGDSAPERWDWGWTPPDAALLVYGRTAEAVAALESELAEAASAAGMPPATAIPLQPLTDDKREPFGFLDGISQPLIRGTYKGLRNADPVHLVEPGEFILGYPDNRGNVPPGPTLPATADALNLLPLVSEPGEQSTGAFERAVVDVPRDLGCNGTFLVIRQLEQDPDRFDAYCDAEASRLRDRLPPPYEMTPEFIAAKLVGRWRDGSSLVRHPYQPRTGGNRANETLRPTTHPDGVAGIERPVQPRLHGDNDFLFGTEDPEALRCPFGAHVRRSNPRDSMDPGSEEQIGITNRHRIIRVGRQYAPQPGQKPGLMFMCLNGDIERQFEFVQQTWLKSPSFHGLSSEKDPLLGDGEHGACGYTIASRSGPLRLSPMPSFVTTKGGGYFFLPGRRLLEFLSLSMELPPAPAAAVPLAAPSPVS